MDFFYKDLDKGKKAEKYVADTLRQRGWGIWLESYDEDVQTLPFDFAAYKGEEEFTVEVKLDGRISETGNILLEDQNLTSGVDGWWRKLDADYLFILCEKTNQIYIFSVKDLKDFVAKYPVKKISLNDWNHGKRCTKRILLASIRNYEYYGYKYKKIKGVN